MWRLRYHYLYLMSAFIHEYFPKHELSGPCHGDATFSVSWEQNFTHYVDGHQVSNGQTFSTRYK